MRRAVREGVRDAGFDVESAVDGYTALDLLEHGQAEGKNFHGIITENFLPDMDGRLLLETLRRQYPKLPLIMLTRYGNEGLEEKVQAIGLTAYLEKPLDIDQLLAALNGFAYNTDTGKPAPAPDFELGYGDHRCYLLLRLRDRKRAMEMYESFLGVDGIASVEAVRGDYDLVLQIRGQSVDEMKSAIAVAEKSDGVRLIGQERVEKPYFSRHFTEFLKHYYQMEAERDGAEEEPGFSTYLFIDIDRYQLERFYAALCVTRGIVRCDIASGGSKVIVQFGTEIAPDALPVLLRKMAEFDGVRRVREAAVIGGTS